MTNEIKHGGLYIEMYEFYDLLENKMIHKDIKEIDSWLDEIIPSDCSYESAFAKDFAFDAAKHGYMDKVKYFLGKSSDITESKHSCLIQAIVYNHYELFMYLMEDGCSQEHELFDAIDCALKNSNYKIFKYLLDKIVVE